MKTTANRVKGLVVEIGGDTTGLDKALSGTNKKIRQTSSELRDVERLLKLDPTNVNLLAQRQRLLLDQYSDMAGKLDTLKEAEKQVQAQFAKGEVSQEQYDALQREIVETEQALKRVYDQARNSSVMLAGLKHELDGISTGAGKVKQKFAPVTAGLVGLAGAAVATVGATEELRSDLSKLDNAAKDQGVGVDAARDAWKDFTVATDEADSAVEATANLLQAGFTESNLQKAVEGLTGAYLRFPDTLKIEGLADSLQETLATGQGVGMFGELLERLGYNLDDYNAKLAEATTDEEKQNLVLQTLADEGLADTYQAWKKDNEILTDNKEANIELQETLAALADKLAPIVTKVVNAVSGLIDGFLQLPEDTQHVIVMMGLLLAAISPVAGIIQHTADLISFLIANPVALLIGAIVGLVALIAFKGDEMQAILQKFDDWLHDVFFLDWTTIFGPGLGDVLNGFVVSLQGIWEGIKQFFDGIIDFIRGVFTGDWERAWQGISDIFEGVFWGLSEIIKAPYNAIIGILNALIAGVNHLIGELNKLSFDVPDWVPKLGGKTWGFNLPTLGSIPYLAKGGKVLQGSAIVGEAGPELLTVSGSGTVVQPLTGGGAARSGPMVNIEHVEFVGYTHQQGAAFVRDLNRQLGRLMA